MTGRKNTSSWVLPEPAQSLEQPTYPAARASTIHTRARRGRKRSECGEGDTLSPLPSTEPESKRLKVASLRASLVRR